MLIAALNTPPCAFFTSSAVVVADQITCAEHGGFVSAVQRFDNRAFGISPAEAEAMDPQQRLLLEHGYAALHGARLPRLELLGSNAGVYLGYSSNDFAAFLASSPASAHECGRNHSPILRMSSAGTAALLQPTAVS